MNRVVAVVLAFLFLVGCGGGCAHLGQAADYDVPPPISSVVAQHTLDSTVKIELPSGGHGSGFFIAPGVVLTAAHVVDDLTEMPVVKKRRGGTCKVTRGVSLVGWDAALLWVDWCDSIPPLSVAMYAPVEGDTVYAAGAPLDAEWSITKGIVADADHRMMRTSWYVLDAVAHPGMSGGPVVDERGYVVGIVVRVMTPDGMSWGGKTLVVPIGEVLGQLRSAEVPYTKRPWYTD